jgi:hypothetical protein
MTDGLRHIGDVLPGVLSVVAGGWLAGDAQAAASCSSSSTSCAAPPCPCCSDLDNRNDGREDTQDVGYFTQARGYFTRGPRESPADVG